jgi:hypothetical protein
MPSDLSALASRFFSFLVDRFPVMCSSDEFHFLPRLRHPEGTAAVEMAFDPDRVDDTLQALRSFAREIEAIGTGAGKVATGAGSPIERAGAGGNGNDAGLAPLDLSIDRELLLACAAALRIELEEKRSWLHDPLFYIKRAFIGLEKALEGMEAGEGDPAGRLEVVPRVLKEAERNVRGVPDDRLTASLSMIADCLAYVRALKEGGVGETHTPALDRAGEGLLSLRRHLTEGILPQPDGSFLSTSLDATLREHFRTPYGAREIFEVGRAEWEEAQASLENMARESGAASWQELYASYRPVESGATDLLALYGKEAGKLVAFFREGEFRWVEVGSPLLITETPGFLRSIRGAASYSAGLEPNESDRFYITTDEPEGETRGHTAMRLHREYRFLSAHEGFPGHYLLDTVRRNLDNPIRRAVESPLFYEGWAYYAESLLEEDGYAAGLLERVVQKKRSLWRAARCMIDAGMTSGLIDENRATTLLEEVGYGPEEARRRVHRFQLNPGYHLCYSLGRHEILKLRKRYGRLGGRKLFHRTLLEGGEIPFALAGKRMQALLGGGGR